ncbi:MAG TPA: sigma 54-interacting transcriptional regulator [Lacipirellulaceae bacterium]|jgi:two-component system response regulator HydG|nr:sigma 54-interacting transcriptional regulator [Lacipirellulaceae bacterium]
MTDNSAVLGQNRSTIQLSRNDNGALANAPLPITAASDFQSQLEIIAPRPATVLIEGETGVGKEVAARRIHALSPRAPQPFVPVDCTVFSTELMESQLFGHVKGAFTGAVGAALGFVRCADGGTLFLDEIGELPLFVQAKLLRCIQERTVVPVGGVEPIPVDIRIIAATHRNLAAMVRAGTFRQDLYFRLNVVRLNIEPLRCRPNEILNLAHQFIDDFVNSYDEPLKSLSPAAEDALLRYAWPGNVRELRNAIERAFLFCADRTIDVIHLPAEIRDAVTLAKTPDPWTHPTFEVDSIPRLADAERLLIARVLKVTGGNQSDAARLLDIERHRLRRKIVAHGLEHLAHIRPR